MTGTETPRPAPLAARTAEDRRAEEAADLMDRVLGVREDIWPPRSLAEAAGVEDAYGDEAAQLAAPHWDGAVALLDGGAGYDRLLSLLARLEAHALDLERQLETATGQARGARELVGLLHEEAHGKDLRYAMPGVAGAAAGGYGVQATLAASLAWPSQPPRRPGRRWRWEAVPRGPDRYVLRHDPGGEQPDWARYPRIRWFAARSTWAEAIEQVSAFVQGTEEEDIPLLEGRLDAVRFRAAIVEQVVREFELLGRVRDFGSAAAPAPEDLDGDGAAFVRAAYEVMASTPGVYTSRTPVLEAVGEELDWPERKVKRVAREVGAYRASEGVGKGRTTGKGREEGFRDFRGVIERLYRRLTPDEGSVKAA